MIPGELSPNPANTCSTPAAAPTLVVRNTGDRPIQVGCTTTLPRPTTPWALTVRLRAACG